MSVQKYFRVTCNTCGLELDAPSSLTRTEQQFVAAIKGLGWKMAPATALTAAAWVCGDACPRDQRWKEAS